MYILGLISGAGLFAFIISAIGYHPHELARKHCNAIESRVEFDKCVKEFLK